MSSTVDQGEITRPLLVFGGPYSNFEATVAMMEQAKALGYEANSVICTGDLIGYCASPREVLETLTSWGIRSIRGNVENQLTEESDDCGCNFVDGSLCDTLSQKWFQFAKRNIESTDLAILAELPSFLRFSMNGVRFVVVHGSYSEVGRHVFPSTPSSLKERELVAAKADVIISGHSGIPFVQPLPAGGVWANAGVIGMPANDGTTRVWFLEITPISGEEESAIEFRLSPLTADLASAAEKIRQARLPLEYAKTLEDGIWPCNAILGEPERAVQGQRIEPSSHTVGFSALKRS